MSPVFDRGRWTAPLALVLLLVAARPAAAAPAPPCLAVTAAVPAATTQACYKEMITYVTAAGQFFAAVDAYNYAVDHGTAKDVQTAGDQMNAASETMVWAGILLVVCLVTLM